ncbi:MAG: polymerase sigma-70 factor [Mucilaginibacter sp.]|nr:polymerase sigma-70 factor [Mucilaginibacter sp.]
MPLESIHFNQEQVLLAQLKEGEPRAFEQIYQLYSQRIYGRLIRLLKDEDMADSILQDVFLRIWERRVQIDPEQPFKAYLYKIAENFVYDYFRKIARDKKLQVKLRTATTEYYDQIEENIFKKENEALIGEAILKLPPQRQKVFLLCKIEGKSYEEAAGLLGISVSTVSNQLVKATKSVKEYVLSANGMALTIFLVAFKW